MKLTLTGLTPMEARTCLEALVTRRYGLRPEKTGKIRFIGRGDFTHFKTSTALRFLTVAQLVESLADHRPKFFEFVYGQMSLKREGALLVVDHEGTEWLSLNDSGVDLPSDDLCHDVSSGSPEADADDRPVGRPVIVRSRDAGVLFGEYAGNDGSTVRLVNARQMWRWRAARGGTLIDCAIEGVVAAGCKFSPSQATVTVFNACALIDCTGKAAASIRAVEGGSWE